MICCSGVEGFARRFLGGPLYPRRDGVYSQDKPAVTHRPQTGILPSHFRCFCRQVKHASKDGPGTFGSPLRLGAREGSGSFMMLTVSDGVPPEECWGKSQDQSMAMGSQQNMVPTIRSEARSQRPFTDGRGGKKCVKTTCNGRNQSRWIAWLAWLEAIHLPRSEMIPPIENELSIQTGSSPATGINEHRSP
jgi:hypothetical protein